MRRAHAAVLGVVMAMAMALVPCIGPAQAQEPATPAPSKRPAAVEPWQPHLRTAVRFAKRRVGRIAIAVRTPTRAWRWHAYRAFPSASVLKAMLLVAYLRRHSVRRRSLRASERALLTPMIRRSANRPANTLVAIVANDGLRRLARRAGMRHFTPVAGIWGNSRITANDQARFFQRIDQLIPPRHRAYAMALLRTIVPAQRWGVARVHPRGWKLYFKGGWGSGTGRVDHQVALLRRGGQRVSIAILTEHDGSHAYGKATLRGIAARLLRGLGRAGDVR